MLRPLPWSAKEDVKFETVVHLLPLVQVMEPELEAPLVQVKPGIICIAAQDVPVQVRVVD
jgi:hypothetical protein